MAGSSQDRVQVGCRKPVIHDDPAREILAGSPTAGDGRTETFTIDAARPNAPERLDPTLTCLMMFVRSNSAF